MISGSKILLTLTACGGSYEVRFYNYFRQGRSLTWVQHKGIECGVIWQNGEVFMFPDSIRMNLALPYSRLTEAFERLKKYIFNS